MNQPRHVKGGDRGFDITAYAHALNVYRASDPTAGDSWPVLRLAKPRWARPRDYGQAMKEAAAAVKRRHPGAAEERGIGTRMFDILAPYMDGLDWWLLRKARSVCPVDPAQGHGNVIGLPYKGTHDHGPGDPLYNWESCNAIDIALPYGSRLLATCDGTIGSQIGPLSSSNPVLLGLRLHLFTRTNEAYYAHLSHLYVAAGQKVRAGQALGLSGAANGVNHLHYAQKHSDPGIAIGEPSPGYRDQGFPG